MGYIPPSQGGFYPTSFTSNRPVSRPPKTEVPATGSIVGKRPLQGPTSDMVSFTNTPALFAGQPQLKAPEATKKQVADIHQTLSKDLQAGLDSYGFNPQTFLRLQNGLF